MREGKIKRETKRLITVMMDHARENYALRNLIAALEGISKRLDIPGFIKDKELAMSVCNALIQMNLEKSGFKKGSIAHKLGLQLYDYIDRMETRLKEGM